MRNADSKKLKTWINGFMAGAVLVNLSLIWVTNHLNTLKGDSDDKKSEEVYFMRNTDSVYREQQFLQDLDGSLHLHQMLLKLSRGSFNKKDYETLKQHEKMAQKRIQEKMLLILRGAYMVANEPPSGKTPNDLFNGLSAEEQIQLINKYEKDALEYGQKLKADMIQLDRRVPFWTEIQAWGLGLNGLLILIATILEFRAT